MTKIKEIFRIIFNKNEEDGKMKEKWSLKKKLLVGVGALGGLVLGIFAYSRNNEGLHDDDDEFEDEVYDYETDETEGLEEEEEIEIEVETQL